MFFDLIGCGFIESCLLRRGLRELVVTMFGCSDETVSHQNTAQRYLLCSPAVFSTLTKILFFTSAQLFGAVFYTRTTHTDEDGYLLHKFVWGTCLLLLTAVTVSVLAHLTLVQSPEPTALTARLRFACVVGVLCLC